MRFRAGPAGFLSKRSRKASPCSDPLLFRLDSAPPQQGASFGCLSAAAAGRGAGAPPPRALLSKLSTSASQRAREHHSRTTFNQIDADGKGAITLADLEAYARAEGLPTCYSEGFMRAALHSGSKLPADAQLSYDAFNVFVRSREGALVRAFRQFDIDGRGTISAEALHHTLSHVAVHCPKSRCVYTCCKQAVACMLAGKQRALEVVPGRGRGAGGGVAASDSRIDLAEFRRYFLLVPPEGMRTQYWLPRDSPGRCCASQNVSFQDPEAPTRSASPLGHLSAGAAAGAASRTLTAPLETLRLQAMTSGGGGAGLLQRGRALVAAKGWTALWLGNGINVLRSAPQKALDFFVFDAVKGLLRRTGPDRQPLSGVQTLSAAAAAGAASCALLYPLEVVRCRLSTGQGGGGLLSTATSIVRKEGFGAMYRGLLPSVGAIVPEAAITYGMFDLLKARYARVTGAEPSVMMSLSFGVLSAATGQFVAYPLETIARRMQVSAAASAVPAHQLLLTLVQQDGVLALYRGLGAASLRVVPMAVCSFGTYELVRKWTLQLEEQLDQQRAARERDACAGERSVMCQ